MHSRKLDCRDCFCRNLTIYDVDRDGRTTYKCYGRNNIWRRLDVRWKPGFAFLEVLQAADIPPPKVDPVAACPPAVVEGPPQQKVEVCLVYSQAQADTAIEEDLILWLESSTKKFSIMARNDSPTRNVDDNTGNHNPDLPHHAYHVAHLYSAREAKEKRFRGMYVLDDRSGARKFDSPGMNDLDDDECLVELYTVFWTHGFDVTAGTYHKGHSDSHTRMTAFSGHLDKKNFGDVVFVPICGVFWTLIAVPCIYGACGDSMIEFDMWKRLIPGSQRKKVDDFERGFAEEARTKMRTNDIKLRVFLSEPGSWLAFPATKLYHGTISLEGDSPRKLVVLHGFRGARF